MAQNKKVIFINRTAETKLHIFACSWFKKIMACCHKLRQLTLQYSQDNLLT